MIFQNIKFIYIIFIFDFINARLCICRRVKKDKRNGFIFFFVQFRCLCIFEDTYKVYVPWRKCHDVQKCTNEIN